MVPGVRGLKVFPLIQLFYMCVYVYELGKDFHSLCNQIYIQELIFEKYYNQVIKILNDRRWSNFPGVVRTLTKEGMSSGAVAFLANGWQWRKN